MPGRVGAETEHARRAAPWHRPIGRAGDASGSQKKRAIELVASKPAVGFALLALVSNVVRADEERVRASVVDRGGERGDAGLSSTAIPEPTSSRAATMARFAVGALAEEP